MKFSRSAFSQNTLGKLLLLTQIMDIILEKETRKTHRQKYQKYFEGWGLKLVAYKKISAFVYIKLTVNKRFPFNAWYQLKGDTYLKKNLYLRCACWMAFSRHQALKDYQLRLKKMLTLGFRKFQVDLQCFFLGDLKFVQLELNIFNLFFEFLFSEQTYQKAKK